MVALRVWWQALPQVDKAIRTIGFFLILLYGGVLGFDRIYQQPKRVDAVVADNERQDGEIAALQAARTESDRNVAYLTCLVEVLAEVPGSSMIRCGNARMQQ
jgi:hypothetical protein